MKKIFNYLAVMLLTVTGFTACDKDGEMSEIEVGAYSFGVSLLPESIGTDYTITFDGQKVSGSQNYVSRTQPTGKLEVFKKGSTTPEFSQEITITQDGEAIQLVKVGNEPLDIYSADKYMQVRFNIVYMPEEDPSLYTIVYDGMEVENNVYSYIRTDRLTGILEIQKENETVYSQEVTLEPDVPLDYLQISTTEYAIVPIEDLPAPPATNSYVRFFFLPADINGANQLELTTYYLAADRVFTEKVETVILNSGEISRYFLYDFASLMSDGQRKRGLVYDLENLETSETLAEKVPADNIGRGLNFKFGTAQIKNNGLLIEIPLREL